MRKVVLRMSLAAMIFSGVVTAQGTDNVFRMGTMSSAVWNDAEHTSFLPAIHELGGNWASISCERLGYDSSKVRICLEQADQLGIKICLENAGFSPACIQGISYGLAQRYEAESLSADDPLGQNVSDAQARNGGARRLDRNDQGWVQTGGTLDPTGVFWPRGGSGTWTACFRLRISLAAGDTNGSNGNLPVCSLRITRNDTLVKDSALLPGCFAADSTTYATIVLSFQGDPTDYLGNYRYELFAPGNRFNHLWSDNVELHNWVADLLLPRDPPWPVGAYAALVDLSASYYDHFPAVCRYYLADECPPSAFLCCAEVNARLRRINPDKTGVSWRPNGLKAYADAVNPDEVWLDCYPLMGRTWPRQDSLEGGGRTPVDSGPEFQTALDYFCSELDSAREAALEHTPVLPFRVDAQGFGEFWCADSFCHFDAAWDTMQGPFTPPDHHEGVWREPSPREFTCISWLSLAYGAQGLDYWLLTTNPGSYPSPSHPDSVKYFYLMGLLQWVGSDKNGHPGVTEYRPSFYRVQSFFKNTLQKIAPTLMKLQSDHIGKWGGAPIGFVTGCSDNLLHIGTFHDQTKPNDNYLIVVNRHCLPTDTRQDTLSLALPADSLPYYLLDVATGEPIASFGRSDTYYNTQKFAVTLAPGQGRLFWVVPFRGSLVANQGQPYGNMRKVSLELPVDPGSALQPDSMCIICTHNPGAGLGDSTLLRPSYKDSTGWIAYRSGYVYDVPEPGSADFGIEYRCQGCPLSPGYTTGISLSWKPRPDSMLIDHNLRFTNSPLCTLCHSGDVLTRTKMQFTNNCLLSPELVADPHMTNPGYWQTVNCSLLVSESLARMAPNLISGGQIYHFIPVESLNPYENWPMTLEADVVSDTFVGTATLALWYTYQDTHSFGHPSTYVAQPVLAIQNGTVARVGAYNYAVDFTFHPDSVGFRFIGAEVGIQFGGAPPGYFGNLGRLWISNIRLDARSPDLNNDSTRWMTYVQNYYPWHLAGPHGSQTVLARYRDLFGNDGHWVRDSICLDSTPPVALISFPNTGQILTDTLVNVLGAAYDPVEGSQSDFRQYKLTWQYVGQGDTYVGIRPESLFYVPKVPSPESLFQLHLGLWNTKVLADSYGQGPAQPYTLTLTVLDSAGNVAQSQATHLVIQLPPGGPPGQPGPGGGMGPMAMTATPNNQLYVGTSGGTLFDYTTSFDSVSSLSLSDSSGPAQITGVGADSSGSLWISDARNLNVRRYSQNGTLKGRIGSSKRFARPNGVYPARNGNVWIADRYHNQISVYDSSGNLKLSFGSYGSDTGQFNRPTGLTLNHRQNCCYVVDSRNQRIQVFDTTGRYLMSFGSPYLSLPVAITLDTNNCAYVADSGAQAVFGFDPAGGHYLTLQEADTLVPIAATTTVDNGYLFTYDRKHQTLMKYLVVYTDTSRMGGGAQSSGTTPILPKELTLYPSFPNPANGRLTIRYAVPRTTRLSIKVYDVSGQQVRILVTNQTTRPGFYNVTWDGKDSRNRQLGNGVYFCRLESNEPRAWSSKPSIQVRTRKLVIAR